MDENFDLKNDEQRLFGVEDDPLDNPLKPIIKLTRVVKSRSALDVPKQVSPTAGAFGLNYGYLQEYNKVEDEVKKDIRGWDGKIVGYKQGGGIIIAYVSPDYKERIELTYYGNFRLEEVKLSYWKRKEGCWDEDLVDITEEAMQYLKDTKDPKEVEICIKKLKEKYGCHIWKGRSFYEDFGRLHEIYENEGGSIELDICFINDDLYIRQNIIGKIEGVSLQEFY